MTKQFLPLSKPALNEDDIAAVSDVLRSGWITTGPKNAELEKQICLLSGAKYAVTLSSATAAMHLTLTALGIGPGDEVITPSLTWVSTINMITLMGATPVFVDVEANTLMTSASLIAPLISSKTKLIIPVHYAGAPVDLDPIYALGKLHNIPIIEDAAHAIGCEYKGRSIGQRGTCLFSLHAIKNITTAEGGVVTTQDAGFAEHIRRLRFHGLAVDAFDREAHGRSPQAEVIEPGYKYNLPDICAVLALGQLQRLDKITQKRTQLARLYQDLLARIPGIKMLSAPDYPHIHCWHLLIIRVDPRIFGMDRDQLIFELKKHGIGAGIHFKAVHLQKYYRENYRFPEHTHLYPLKNTEYNSQQICSLPLFPDMSERDVIYVTTTLAKIFGDTDIEA
ncbi:aminotransferase class I/II-fold pyridoxal phosphate-dependent enzyme [Psychromonas sp.]|uniref:aminotransferase class I/II-fold pyridoxal phosphate-dependent enzyme n=1 Tax=Psychromonas sp. TaxID=1884585 RepID=UPI003568EF28